MASFDLERFVVAQAGVYERALDELRQRHKASHWMWFVFPQIAGLGSSPMAVRYALSSLAEARAYLDHPRLGSRLQECATACVALRGRTASAVFGHPDDLKLRSSLTLFEVAAPYQPVFGQALDALCGGERDRVTLRKTERG